MANNEKTWNPRDNAYKYTKKRVSNPAKIELRENDLRTRPTRNGNNIRPLDEAWAEENGEGIARRKRNTREQIEDVFRKTRKTK